MTERLTLDDPAFGRLFTDITRSWFRLETLQHYDVSYERESFDAFQARQAMPHDPADDAWTAMVDGHVSNGRVLQRVHIITEPLSPYVEYELAWGYKAGIAGGEAVRVIVCTNDMWPDGLPGRHDFWLLDDDLWIMSYDDQGRLDYAERSTDPEAMETHRRWRDIALTESIPLTDYLDTIPKLLTRAVS